jgi:hypothetical protein
MAGYFPDSPRIPDHCSRELVLRRQKLLLFGVIGHMFQHKLSVTVRSSRKVKTKACLVTRVFSFLEGRVGDWYGIGASECESKKKGAKWPKWGYKCSI